MMAEGNLTLVLAATDSRSKEYRAMAKQRSLEERLADTQAQKARINERLKKLEDQRRNLDQRKRLKGEKVILQMVLDKALRSAEFRAELVAELAATPALKPEDRDAALWVLTGGKNEIDARPGFSTVDAVSESEHPHQRVA